MGVSKTARLEPGETYALDTDWFPAQMGKEFKTVKDPGVVGLRWRFPPRPAASCLRHFWRVCAGKLEARLFDRHGAPIANTPLQAVSPAEVVEQLHVELKVSAQTARVALRVADAQEERPGFARGGPSL